MSMKCPLHDCTERPKDGTGFSAHCRAHVLRGEAIFTEDRKSIIRVPEVPLAKGPYERKMRMAAIKNGEIKAEISLPSAAQRKSKKDEPREIVHAPSNSGFDLSKLTPDQINALRAQLNGSEEVAVVEDHSCPTTRAMDRMKDAIVMTTVAEMLEEVPADQMLVMLSQMRRMPAMTRR